LTVYDLIGNHAEASWSFTTNAANLNPKLLFGTVENVTSAAWTTVQLAQTYTSMVVICALPTPTEEVREVVRVRNAAGNQFECKIEPLDSGSTGTQTARIRYLVVEEGVYTQANAGIKLEARKFDSTVTDTTNQYVGAIRNYDNAYTVPLVLGQVLSCNQTGFLAFWCSGEEINSAPTSASLRVGKHAGNGEVAAPWTESLGYVVFESSSDLLQKLLEQ